MVVVQFMPQQSPLVLRLRTAFVLLLWDVTFFFTKTYGVEWGAAGSRRGDRAGEGQHQRCAAGLETGVGPPLPPHPPHPGAVGPGVSPGAAPWASPTPCSPPPCGSSCAAAHSTRHPEEPQALFSEFGKKYWAQPSNSPSVFAPAAVLFPYKLQLSQRLKRGDKAKRQRFCRWLLGRWGSPRFRQSLLFSDEATFYLNGTVNEQNCRVWGRENPHALVERDIQAPHLV